VVPAVYMLLSKDRSKVYAVARALPPHAAPAE
jgi:hypothetical protein